MENYFTKQMADKSDSELQYVIENKNYFQEEAYIAAIDELEKRKLATEYLLEEKAELIEHKNQKLELAEKEEEEKVVERKKVLKESIELLKPSKNYFFTPIIVYLNILIFIIMVLNGVHPIDPTVESLVNWGGNIRSLTLDGQYWRLITNVFLHAGLLHLLFNMFALLYIGGVLETKFGKNRYFFVYIITGIFASIASISYNENIVSIGASGAIFGMYGLFLSLLISKNFKIPKESKQNLLSSILLFIGYNLFYGFTSEGIDNAAHIGGLVSGFIIGFAYYPVLRAPKYSKFISSGLALILLVVILILPRFVSNKTGEFQNVMREFSINEEKALWMYREEFFYMTLDESQRYMDRLKTEGIDLWEENITLLNSLTDLSDYLKQRVDILTEYSKLRKESCEIMQDMAKYNKDSDLKKLEYLNILMQSKIDDLQRLNE